jgi:hypothetical protein
MTVEHKFGVDHTITHRRKRFRCPDARNSVNAWATTAEIVLPDSRARARTRATSAAGTLTVNTVVSAGTSRPTGGRTLGIPACLAHRAAEPPGQHPRRLCWRHPRSQQLRGGVDPPRVLPATDTTTSTTDIRHDIAVLPDMSRSVSDTPRPLQPSILKRDIETEIAHCVGGVTSPVFGAYRREATAAECLDGAIALLAGEAGRALDAAGRRPAPPVRDPLQHVRARKGPDPA